MQPRNPAVDPRIRRRVPTTNYFSATVLNLPSILNKRARRNYNMTDILGAISASLDLAIFITKQVEKVMDAPETVQVITDDVRRLGRILAQLSDTLRPDPRAGYTAVRLSSQGLKNGLESVQRCNSTLKKLDCALEGIFGKDQWNRDEPLRFGRRARLNYAGHDGRVRRLLAELRECKWDIMLSNSVNQLFLAKQPSQWVFKFLKTLHVTRYLC